MATIQQLTDEQERLFKDYDPALREAKLAELLKALIASNNDLEARVTALEPPG